MLFVVDASGSMAARQRMTRGEDRGAVAAARRLPAAGPGRHDHLPGRGARSRCCRRPPATRSASPRLRRAAHRRAYPARGRPARGGRDPAPPSAAATRAAGRCWSWSPTGGPPAAPTRSASAPALAGIAGRGRGLRVRAGAARPGPPAGRRPGRRLRARSDAAATPSWPDAEGRLMPQGKPETRAGRRAHHPAAPPPAGAGRAHRARARASRPPRSGWRCGRGARAGRSRVFQFVKSPKWRVGEEAALRALGDTGKGAPVTWHKMGEGWSWIQRPGAERDHAAEAAEGWAQIKRDLAAETLPVLRAGRVHLPDEVGLGRRRRRGGDAARPARHPARGDHRPRRPPGPGRGRRPGHRDDQGASTRWTPAARASRASSGDVPRVVIAAPASGHGKTTVATGLLAAFAARGLRGGAVQGRPGLHRPRLPRARRRAARPQPRPGAGRRGPDRAAVRARRGRRRPGRRRGRDGPVRRAHRRTATSAPPRTSPRCSTRRSCWWWTPPRRAARWPRWCTASASFGDGAARRGDPQPGRLGPARGAAARGVRGGRHAGARRAAPQPTRSPRRRATSAWCRPPSARAEARGLGGRARRRWSPPASTWTRSLAVARVRAAAGGRRPGRPARGRRARSPGRPVVAVAGGPAFTFAYAETAELLRRRRRRGASPSTRCATRRCRRAPARWSSAAASPRCTPRELAANEPAARGGGGAGRDRGADRRRVRRAALAVPHPRRRPDVRRAGRRRRR